MLYFLANTGVLTEFLAQKVILAGKIVYHSAFTNEILFSTVHFFLQRSARKTRAVKANEIHF